LEGGTVSKKDFIAREEMRSSQIYRGLATSKRVWEKLNDTVDNRGARVEFPIMAI
jgi:hypothetical protein